MARTDALLRISKILLARRGELRKRLHEEMDGLALNPLSGTGDVADAAFDASGEEVAAHLAEIEAKELSLIEIALMRIKQGKYGVCNGCDGKIPVARLDALPYSVLCVKCQREAEIDTDWLQDKMIADFDKIRDHSGADREITIADLEAGLDR